MKIAIIVAMQKELDLLLPLLTDPHIVTINETTLHIGKIGRHDVAMQKCGIGKVNAAIGTLTLIDLYHPDMVINTGVAGGTGSDAGILDIVLADAVGYHDVWCGPGTEPGQAAGFPKRMQCAFTPKIHELIPDAKVGTVASGDIFVSRPEEVEHILSIYPDAKAVDMESGAIAQVCHLKNIPFVCIRVISDTPGRADNISQYNNFWEDAPQRSFHALQHILESI